MGERSIVTPEEWQCVHGAIGACTESDPLPKVVGEINAWTEFDVPLRFTISRNAAWGWAELLQQSSE